MDLRALLLILSLVFKCLCFCEGFFLGGNPVNPIHPASVHSPAGDINGKLETIVFDGIQYNITKFLGIPYAEPPVGQNRFKRPVPKARFSSTYDALEYGNSCLQGQGLGMFRFNSSEDCLFLNVFVPGKVDPNNKIPVMFWIHGGGFTSGTSSLYPGDYLSAYGQVIVVTINYRVAQLGWLRTKEQYGNFGLFDQHQALRWVNDNIGAFGGDVSNITIFGESAGSSSVVYHVLFPGNKGLFQRAIAQSGGITSSWAFRTDEEADDVFDKFSKRVGCDSGSHTDIMTCLRSKTSDEIAAVMKIIEHSSEAAAPSRDNRWAPMYPQRMMNPAFTPQASLDVLHSVDFMMGSMSLDGALFLPFIGNFSSIDDFKISRTDYEKGFIPITLKEIFKGDNITKSAIAMTILEYTNWSMPDDDKARTRQLVDMRSHCSMFAPMVATAQLHVRNKSRNTYIFEFATAPLMHVLHTPNWLNGPKNANHADDLLFVFGFHKQMLDGFRLSNDDTKDPPYRYSAQNILEAKAVMTMWTNFAKTGNPNTPNSVPIQWPTYNTTSQHYLEITPKMTQDSVKQHIAAKQMAFWLRLLPSLLEQ